jgi:septum formation protein
MLLTHLPDTDSVLVIHTIILMNLFSQPCGGMGSGQIGRLAQVIHTSHYKAMASDRSNHIDRKVVLASRSVSRASLLRNAGVAFEARPATVDEKAIRDAMLAENARPRDVADALAELKARRMAFRVPDALVLGADQVLECEGQIFGKPGSREEAREQLAFLSGRTHRLLSAAVIYEDARPVWRHVGTATLRMRPIPGAVIEDYLLAEGEKVLTTVGCYRIEGVGAQLFSHIGGDYFSILGLPLLEVLGFLRTRGIGLA